MGDHDDGAVGEDPAQGLAQGRGDGDVERGHGLVEQQQLGVRGQGAGDGGSLGLSAGELGGVSVGERLEADLAEPVAGGLAGRVSAAAGASGAECDVVEDGQVREQQGFLGQQGDVPVVRGDVHLAALAATAGELAAVERDVAAVGSQQPGGDGQDGGLPGAVGSQERHGLALGDVERELDAAVEHGGVVLEHHRVLLLCRANPITRMATTTRTRERATAACASVSRRR